MKNLLLILIAVSSVLIISSCGSAGIGIGAKKVKKADLSVGDMNALKSYKPNLPVWYKPNPETALKTDSMNPDKKRVNFTIPGGMAMLPIDLFQIKPVTGDTIHLARVEPDLKISLPDNNLVNGKAKPRASSKGDPVTGFGSRKTFDLCGELMAQGTNDNRGVDNQRYLISMHLYDDIVNRDKLILVQYNYNGEDTDTLKIYEEDFISSRDGLYAGQININYGNLFTIVNSDGQTVDLSNTCLHLNGLEIIDNPNKPPSKVFRIITNRVASNALSEKRSETRIKIRKRSYARGSGLAKARTFNPRNYPKCWVRVQTKDIEVEYKSFYRDLTTPDINGEAAIGETTSGGLNETVIISPDVLRKYPKLWDDYGYRDQVECPGHNYAPSASTPRDPNTGGGDHSTVAGNNGNQGSGTTIEDKSWWQKARDLFDYWWNSMKPSNDNK